MRKIFTNKEYSKEGVFEMTLYIKGKPVKVTVDDRLPISEGKDPHYTNFGVKRPVNSNVTPNGAWWVPLIEKAMSK